MAINKTVSSYILIFLWLIFPLLLVAKPLKTSQAAAHIGEEATVCGTVYGGYYASNSRGQPTFVNLDGNYPNQKFTIVIWGEARDRFDAPERNWKGRKVCVEGYIDSYRGVPQIVLRSTAQLHSVGR